MVKTSAQGLVSNYPQRLNKHILFASTSPSSSGPIVEPVTQHGSNSPLQVEIYDPPLINVVDVSIPTSPPPQVATTFPLLTPFPDATTF